MAEKDSSNYPCLSNKVLFPSIKKSFHNVLYSDFTGSDQWRNKKNEELTVAHLTEDMLDTCFPQ